MTEWKFKHIMKMAIRVVQMIQPRNAMNAKTAKVSHSLRIHNNNSMTTKNEHAQALGRLGKNIPKTLSAAALAQRKKAAKMPRKNAKVKAK